MARAETRSWALLVARFLLAFIFLMGALQKFTHLAQTAQWLAAHDLPASQLLAVLAACVELLGGLSLLLGIATPLGATLLALYLIPVSLVFHDFWTMGGAERQMQFVEFMKNLAIIGGLVYTAVFGAGAISLDDRLQKQSRLPTWWPRRPFPAS
jgi:putative oxidoreductase